MGSPELAIVPGELSLRTVGPEAHGQLLEVASASSLAAWTPGYMYWDSFAGEYLKRFREQHQRLVEFRAVWLLAPLGPLLLLYVCVQAQRLELPPASRNAGHAGQAVTTTPASRTKALEEGVAY